MGADLYPIPGPWRGRLAIVPRPRGGDWLEDQVRGWRALGIGVVVSLLVSQEEDDFGASLRRPVSRPARHPVCVIPSYGPWSATIGIGDGGAIGEASRRAGCRRYRRGPLPPRDWTLGVNRRGSSDPGRRKPGVCSGGGSSGARSSRAGNSSTAGVDRYSVGVPRY